jgi:hypothetical protein
MQHPETKGTIDDYLLGYSGRLAAQGADAAKSFEATLSGMAERGFPSGGDARRQRDALLGASANLHSLSASALSAARSLTARARSLTASMPLTTPLNHAGPELAITVNVAGTRLEVILAAIGTTLAEEISRRLEISIAERDRKGLHALPDEQWLSELVGESSPALAATKFARQVARENGLHFPRETVAGAASAVARAAKAEGAYALTLPEKDERIVAVCANGHLVYGPELDLVYVEATGQVRRDTLSQAHFCAGAILALNLPAA